MTPNGQRVELASRERVLLVALFSQEAKRLSLHRWEDVNLLSAGGLKTSRTLSITVRRLRLKCLDAGCDLPLWLTPEEGCAFMGPCGIEHLRGGLSVASNESFGAPVRRPAHTASLSLRRSS